MKSWSRARTVGVLVAAALSAACLVGLVRALLAPPWARRAHQRLGPWQPGMDLRATFDTLPEVGGQAPRSTFLDHNGAAWVERWRMLASAREQIDVASFIVRDDVFGLSFLGHLLARARGGVRVRVLVDAHGTEMARSIVDEDYLDELVAGGVEAKVYRPLPDRILQALVALDPASAVASEHDKLLLVDGRAGLMGGRNVGAEYFADPARHPEAFLDADLLLEGPAGTAALTRAFEVEWKSPSASPIPREALDLDSCEAELLGAYRAMDAWLRGRALDQDPDARPHVEALRAGHPELLGALDAPRPPWARAEVRVLDSSARRLRMDDPVTEGLRRLLASARERVLIVTPYLVLGKEAVAELAAAARRGVEITILTNSPTSSDNALSQAYFVEQWPELMAQVPGLRLFVRGDGHNIHAKTGAFDRTVAVVSTYNLDPMSMAINGEIAVVAWSDELAAKVEASASSMLDAGPPATLEYRIARDARGEAVRDEDGRPRIEFGPEDHTDQERWSSLNAWWTAIRAARQLGVDPVSH